MYLCNEYVHMLCVHMLCVCLCACVCVYSSTYISICMHIASCVCAFMKFVRMHTCQHVYTFVYIRSGTVKSPVHASLTVIPPVLVAAATCPNESRATQPRGHTFGREARDFG